MKKTAIIIGASSGIGRNLTELLLDNRYKIGILARRNNLLEEVKSIKPDSVTTKAIDISNIDDVQKIFKNFLLKFKYIDLIINCAGTGFINKDLELLKEIGTNKVNVDGFVAISNISLKYFINQGFGHYATITSIAAVRGGADAPAYNASKAYQVNYLEGLNQYFSKKKMPILITDIRPGYVDTRMAQGDSKFWIAKPDIAAKQIFNALKKKKKLVYVTRRWKLIAWILRLLPKFLLQRT